ncbi:MAG: SEL1-like repeat protein, partial [Lentisphaeria bacterium]|nr:SEL1-like repeat protein [Lentisphaeria bacterium]
MKEYNWRKEREKQKIQPQTTPETTGVETGRKTGCRIAGIVAATAVIVVVLIVYYNLSPKSEEIVIPAAQTDSTSYAPVVEWKPEMKKNPVSAPQKQVPPYSGILSEANAAYKAGDYQTAAKKYKIAADRGSAAAQYRYAVFSLQGQHVPKDLVQAERYMKLSAEQGFNLALTTYGMLLLSGEQFPKAPKKGEAMLFRVLDDRTLPLSDRFTASWMLFTLEMFDTALSCEEYLKFHNKGRRGIEYCASQNHDDAGQFWRDIKDISDAEYLYRVGSHLVAENYPAGELTLESAASLGHREAGFLLAGILIEGKYTERNIQRARQYADWFMSGADMEKKYALLVFFFLNKDHAFSLPHLCKLAEAGHTGSQMLLFWIYFEGCEWMPRNFEELGDIPRDNSTAIRFLKMAAEKNHTPALSLLGLLYMSGAGVPQNIELGLQYTRQAARQGDKQAQEFLNKHKIQTIAALTVKNKSSLAKI